MTNASVCDFSGHTIICGWNDHAAQVLKELEASGQRVAVVARELPEVPANSGALFITGDASRDDVLKRAGVMNAASAIILAEGAQTLPADSVDARAILTALAVESLHPDIYTVLEILNPANEIHARRAHVDNVIFCDRLIADVIAICTSQKGISSFIDDIFSQSDNGAALCTEDAASCWNGKKLGELFAALRSKGNLPLGVMRPGTSVDREEWIHEINPDENAQMNLPLKVVYISGDSRTTGDIHDRE